MDRGGDGREVSTGQATFERCNNGGRVIITCGRTCSTLGLPFEYALRDGVFLCKLMNKLAPGIIPKINTTGGDYKMMDNISQYDAILYIVLMSSSDDNRSWPTTLLWTSIRQLASTIFLGDHTKNTVEKKTRKRIEREVVVGKRRDMSGVARGTLEEFEREFGCARSEDNFGTVEKEVSRIERLLWRIQRRGEGIVR